MSGDLTLLEVMGAGAALLDYDRDGDLDAYLVQGRMLGRGKDVSQATFPPRHPEPLSDRLYRNDLRVLADGSRSVRFADVTAASGLGELATGYGMGVATGDYDGDGLTDLYVANDQVANFLWHNQGDGTFREDALLAGCAVDREGLPEASMGVSAEDRDDDGDEDLDTPCWRTTRARPGCCSTWPGRIATGSESPTNGRASMTRPRPPSNGCSRSGPTIPPP
jgi:hypothetical protein